MQIPTNPRIASGLALGVAKSDKENSTVNAAPKPAYVGVSVPKHSSKSSQEDTDSMIKVIMLCICAFQFEHIVGAVFA